MSTNREWLDSWLSRTKTTPVDGAAAPDSLSEPSDEGLSGIAGSVLASLSTSGQRRLIAILQQNPVPPQVRFVAFRAEAFREKDLLDSFEAMLKRPFQRTEAHYVPHTRTGTHADET